MALSSQIGRVFKDLQGKTLTEIINGRAIFEIIHRNDSFLIATWVSATEMEKMATGRDMLVNLWICGTDPHHQGQGHFFGPGGLYQDFLAALREEKQEFFRIATFFQKWPKMYDKLDRMFSDQGVLRYEEHARDMVKTIFVMKP